MLLGEMQVTRSKRAKLRPRVFPAHASVKAFTPPKMAIPVSRSERGPEKSSAAGLGCGPDKRYLFGPRGRTGR